MKRVLFLGFLCLFSVSCSQMTILRTKELVEVQKRVDSLRNEVMVIEESRLERVEREDFNRISLEIAINRITEMLMQLSGNVAESQTQLSELGRRTDMISIHMAERARQDSLFAVMKEQERMDLFNLAKSNFDLGNFALAVGDFADYIQRHPNTEDAREALFLMAEANFALDSLDTAEALFKQYYAENREGQFACAALYKMGLIYDKQGKNRSRDAVWGQLERQCPESTEFRLLQENQRR